MYIVPRDTHSRWKKTSGSVSPMGAVAASELDLADLDNMWVKVTVDWIASSFQLRLQTTGASFPGTSCCTEPRFWLSPFILFDNIRAGWLINDPSEQREKCLDALLDVWTIKCWRIFPLIGEKNALYVPVGRKAAADVAVTCRLLTDLISNLYMNKLTKIKKVALICCIISCASIYRYFGNCVKAT